MHALTSLRGMICLLVAIAGVVTAEPDYYVATNGAGNGVGGWTNATNSLQGAIDAAPAGSVVWVSNGVYRADDNAANYLGTNVAYINKSLELRGWSGNPAETVIDGGGTTRCVTINLTGAGNLVVVDGLTLVNGYGFRRGGGALVHGNSTSTAKVQNCVILDNVTDNPVGTSDTNPGGGGLYCYPGSTDLGFQLLLSNCVVRGNYAKEYIDGTTTNTSTGGGLRLRVSAEIVGCEIISNKSSGTGGGIYAQPVTTCRIKIDRCLISSNKALVNGGGLYISTAPAGLLELYNALIFANTAVNSGGGIYCTGNYILGNCTISGNTADNVGSGVFYHSGGIGTNSNIIIYDNIGGDISLAGNASFLNCCTTLVLGGDNITNPPLFVGDGDFRLQSASPCVNTGTNLPWMRNHGIRDLDQRTRIDRFSGIVDRGCYERLVRGCMFNFR